MKTDFNLSVFHDYDIRGIYPGDLNEEAFFTLGRAIASYTKANQIAVGHDTRLSSPTLHKALCDGIRMQGTDVVDLGLISTEIHYFAAGKYNFDASIIITASHNPPQYNGLKLVTKGMVPLHGGFGLPQIKKYCETGIFPTAVKKGSIKKLDVMRDWIAHALSFVDLKSFKNLKVVCDAGNGMAGISWAKLIGIVPFEIIPLYFEPDGHFPNHLPSPIEEKNTVELRNKIIETKADIGFAFDGDADRIFVMDENGNNVSGTITTAILARCLLEKNHNKGTVLYNAVCGRIVPETIQEAGGKAVRVRVGHSFIKEYMKKEDAIMAGEHSGHYYFCDNFNAESSLIVGLLLLEYLSVKGQKLSQIVKEFEKYPHSGEINFKVENTDDIFTQLEQKFADCQSLDRLDGLSIWYKDWWVNIRASKTEPLLRINVEADDKATLAQNLKTIENLIIENKGQKHE